MKENANKYLDQITEKLFTEQPLESPSSDFSSKVMVRVEGLQNETVTVYKPLISKAGWFIIITGFLAVVVFVYLSGNGTETSGWFNTLNVNILFQNKASHIWAQWHIPDTLLYPTLFLSLLVWIQVLFVKNYCKKRMQF